LTHEMGMAMLPSQLGCGLPRVGGLSREGQFQ
jgi:hypothetical protein